jgi:hypothetical protein
MNMFTHIMCLHNFCSVVKTWNYTLFNGVPCYKHVQHKTEYLEASAKYSRNTISSVMVTIATTKQHNLKCPYVWYLSVTVIGYTCTYCMITVGGKHGSLSRREVLRSGGTAPPYLTLTLDGDKRSASRPGRFIPREITPSTIGEGAG